MGKDKLSTAAKKILDGIEDAIAFTEGDTSRASLLEIEIPDVDAAEVREKTGLSQDSFSKLIGVSAATLRNWEQNRREPQGPAKTLLALVNEKPTIVQEVLGKVLSTKKKKRSSKSKKAAA